jgi:Bacterial aa3 type cytochrome c oxidase subunit IV
MLEGLMADHGEVEYATAEGNDLPAHEANYEAFIQFTVIGAVFVITILVGLAIGGVLGHWFLLAAVIIAGVIAAGVSAWTGSRIPGIAVLGLSLLTLLIASYS